MTLASTDITWAGFKRIIVDDSSATWECIQLLVRRSGQVTTTDGQSQAHSPSQIIPCLVQLVSMYCSDWNRSDSLLGQSSNDLVEQLKKTELVWTGSNWFMLVHVTLKNWKNMRQGATLWHSVLATFHCCQRLSITCLPSFSDTRSWAAEEALLHCTVVQCWGTQKLKGEGGQVCGSLSC